MTRTLISAAVTALFVAASSLHAQQFEAPKLNAFEFDGLTVDFGASFTQSFQALEHSNSLPASGLADIGAGFNLAAANAWLSADVAPAMRVVVDAYLSSRHHPEFWMKGGYLLIDGSPIDHDALEMVMSLVTLKAGHFELNYGDAHFRRTDNAASIGNPFVENLILDAFTTEIGGEAYVRVGPVLAMLGVTSGQNKGDVTAPDERSWAFLTKAGFDHQIADDLRVRLTASTYQNDNAGRATLYGGDRAGSAYWAVMDVDNGKSFTNGRVNPNFTEEIKALQINPFIKFRDLEFFGVIEKAEGRTAQETDMRSVTQYAGDVVYRLLDDRLYVAGRYNTVSGELSALGLEQTVDRKVLSAGWFISPHVLLKGEYVTQSYDGWNGDDLLNGGNFNGIVIQGVVGF